MTNLENLIKSAMDQHGVTAQGWRVKIVNVEAVNFNWATAETEVYEPCKRKPSIVWNVAIHMPRNMVDFNKSEFHYC